MSAPEPGSNVKLDGPEIVVSAFIGDDGAIVIQVDTTPGVGHVRINLNEAPVWDADPEVGP